ncbi:uncharacterized protein LOC143299009 [Babylonia areolata]|uniref:uncharacterized protein LOC143299009 n=1 Tax=Babylonia areolata TaxID=304850 RepID=UPI003FD20274
MAAGSTPSGPGTNHPVKIFANIFIAFIGAGVLGLPYAFKEAGILEGILTMTFVAVISTKAMLLIIDCKYQMLGRKVRGIPEGMAVDVERDGRESLIPSEVTNGHDDFTRHEQDLMISIKERRSGPVGDISYGDVGYHALGHTGRVLVDIAIVISQTGFCCAYIIFISENLSDYIKGVKVGQWLLILLPPLFLLTLLRHLNSLAMSSLLAQVSNLMAFGVVFWFDFEHLFKITIHPKEMSIKGFPFFLAIAIYCYEGAGMILSLETSLSEEVRHKFKKFFITAMTVVTTLYITFGSCGYLSFGPETKSIITLNLPKGTGFDFGMLVKSCLCLGVFFTYPIMMFPVVKLLETYLLPDAGKSVWKANCLRFCLVVLTGFVVLAVPNFANLMALVGSSCCTLLAFILPGIFHMNIFRGSLTRSQLMLDWMLVVIGVCGTVIGTMDALKRLTEMPDSGADLVSTADIPWVAAGEGGGASSPLGPFLPSPNTSTTPISSQSTLSMAHVLSGGRNNTVVDAVVDMATKVAQHALGTVNSDPVAKGAGGVVVGPSIVNDSVRSAAEVVHKLLAPPNGH